jgi:hypothetical protein
MRGPDPRVRLRIGRVPGVLVFDNATGVGHRFGREVTMTRVFNAFQAHYRIGEVRFCNPYSGNEKGSVENAVGFLRRNLMVPMPKAESLEALTRMLLERCGELAHQPHYRKEGTIEGLFEQDRAEMLALPGVSFDPVRWEIRHADNLGIVTVDGARYLAGAKYHNLPVHVGLRAFDVEIRSTDGTRIVRLDRAYGRNAVTAADPASILPVLARKPRSWGESPLRGDFPETGAPGAGRDGGPGSRTTPQGAHHVKPGPRVRGHRPGVPCDSRIRTRALVHRHRPDRQAHRPGRRRAPRPRSEPLRPIHEGDERMTDTTQEPISRPRGGRTVSKSTIEEVMELSRNLPLTRKVLKASIEHATPGQLGLLADLFRAENAQPRAIQTPAPAQTTRTSPRPRNSTATTGAQPTFRTTGAGATCSRSTSSSGPRTWCSTGTSAAARPTWPSR